MSSGDCSHKPTIASDVVALTGCARSSLGICASSSGAIAGLVLWQVMLQLDAITPVLESCMIRSIHLNSQYDICMQYIRCYDYTCIMNILRCVPRLLLKYMYMI